MFINLFCTTCCQGSENSLLILITKQAVHNQTILVTTLIFLKTFVQKYTTLHAYHIQVALYFYKKSHIQQVHDRNIR